MTSLRGLGVETLVKKDGLVAAKSLTFDRDRSEVAFETATFGMG